jgi:stage V sporulation protein B
MRILDRLFTENRDIVLASHNNIFLDRFADPNFNPSNFLYGIYGAISTVMNLVPTITGSFGMSALPMISSAWTAGNKAETKKHVETSLRICLMIGAPAGFGLSMLAEPILGIIYRNSPTAQIGPVILQLMGIVSIAVALMGIVTAMFQAIGRTSIPLILTAVSLGIKVAVNWVMVSIPKYNIIVAPLGNLAGFTIFCIAGLLIFCLITKIRINLWGTLIKPLIAGAITGIVAKFAYKLIHLVIGSNIICTVGAIGLAVIAYLICVLLLRILEKEDILSLPGGKKLGHILEKMQVIR